LLYNKLTGQKFTKVHATY